MIIEENNVKNENEKKKNYLRGYRRHGMYVNLDQCSGGLIMAHVVDDED